MNQWVLNQTILVGKQVVEHLFISSMGATGMLVFQLGFGAVKAVLFAYLLYIVTSID